MMILCQRCGGVITDQQTHMDGENGGKLHYYCSWKNWEEHKERLLKVNTGEKDRTGFFNSNWLTKK